MARFAIKSPDGTTTRYTGTPVYHGTHLKPGYIEFREIASPTLINWQIGDYVDYSRTGFRYKLYSVPQPTKQAVASSCGDAFVYRDVQLFCAAKDLEICPFRDLVISDNTIHFTTLQNVSTYEDVFGIARRIQANLDSFYGDGTWSIRVIDTSDADLREVLLETKEFSISDGSVLDALNLIYSQWKGIGWVYSVVEGVNTVTIGRPNIQDGSNTTSVFAYGIGNGITVLKKEQSDKNDLVTRLYAYGSTRNLIARYYNNITPAIKDAESVYIPNLMIPLSYWGQTDSKRDARKAYLEADGTALAKYGLRPKTIYFDGNGDYDEIYPSLETMTAGQLRAAMQPTDEYYPSETFAPDVMRLDEVAGAVNPADNGVIGETDGKKYKQTVSLSGIDIDRNISFAYGQDTANVNLGAITASGSLSSPGTVKVTPDFTGYISSGATLGSAKVYVWLEVGTTKYPEQAATVERQKFNNYHITLPTFSVPVEVAGTAVLKARVVMTPASVGDGFPVGIHLTNGSATLEVQGTVETTFQVAIHQVGFDISKQASAISDGLCTIAFKSGWCAGREFTVKKCEYQSANDRWLLTVARHNDESIGQYFPNSIYAIAPGDRFVLIDLTMPEVYVTAAQQRLYDRASDVLASLSTPKYVYEPEIDAKVLAQHPETILEGMYMPVMDPDIVDGTTEWVLIDSVEINEGDAAIPTYKITLQDEKRDSFLSKITRQSGRNAHDITEITLKDLRTEMEDTTPPREEEEDISVTVKATHPVIGYEFAFDEDPVNEVVLSCETTGIPNPTFQWYYLGPVSWVEISGATGQTYTVDPDSSLYYLDGEIVEDFRCVVSGDPDLSGEVQVMKVLSHAVTASLSHPAHLFDAGEEYAVAGEDTTDVLTYVGTERVASNVKMSAVRFLDSAGDVIVSAQSGGKLLDGDGKYLKDSDGKYLVTTGGSGASIYDTDNNLMMSIEVVDNNTTNAHLVITVTEYMNIPVGKIEIPVIIQEADASANIAERVVNLYYSWALALTGASPLIADITNEADGVAVGSNEKLETTVSLSTGVVLYYGLEAEELSSVVPTVPQAFANVISAVATIASGAKSATVAVTLTASAQSPIDFSGVNSVEIPIALTSARGTRTVTYTILIVADGEDGAVFKLMPSHDVVKGTYDSSGQITYSPTEVSCTRYTRTGSGALSPSTTGTLRYSVDNGTTISDYSSAVSASLAVAAGRIIFYWYVNSVLVDRETVPIVTDGTSPVIADLTNEMDGIGVGSDGILQLDDPTSPVTTSTIFRMWLGTTQLTLSSLTVDLGDLPNEVTYQLGHVTSDPSSALTGEITFTIEDGADLSDGRYAISITGTHSIGQRTLVYTLMGVRDGDDGTTFILVPSCTSVKKDSEGNLSESYVTCTAKDNKGESLASPIIYFQREGVEQYPVVFDLQTYPNGIDTSTILTTLTFYLFLETPNATYSNYVDIETIPLIIDGEDGTGTPGQKGKSMRGISSWNEYGYGGTQASPSHYEGRLDPIGDFIDVVVDPFDGFYYRCVYRENPTSQVLATDYQPHENLVDDITRPGCWELMNNYENIATKALAVDQAVINDLVSNFITVDQLETVTKQVKIAGNQITVKDSSGTQRALIHSEELSVSRNGSSVNAATVQFSGTAGAQYVDVEILGTGVTFSVQAANNIVTIPDITISAMLSASANAPRLLEWYVTFFATNGTELNQITGKMSYPLLIGRTIASFSTTLPVGTWSILCRISPNALADDQIISGSTVMASALAITYPLTQAFTELAGDGFQTVWSASGYPAQGFRATKDGAKVIKDGDVYEAIGGGSRNNLAAIRKIIVCTSYPSTGENGTLYIKVTT